MTETLNESVVDYLATKGVQTWPAAGSEITAHCFFDCVSDKGKGKCYFNTETWLWDCKRCGRHGGRYLLLEHFGDRDEFHGTGPDPATKMAVLGAYTDYAADLLRRNDDKLLYLFGRGLHAETIMDARLGFVPRNFSVAGSLDGFTRKDFENAGMLYHGRDFHAGRLTIPYLQRGRALQIRGKEIGGRYYTPAGDQVRLYNADSLRGADTVVIAEGELDSLILQQTLRLAPHSPNENAAIVGIPGAGAWPGGKDGISTYFREARRVYIALDPDEPGVRAARQLKETLGSKARIVMLPQDNNVRDDNGEPVKCDWTEYLRHKDDAHPWGGHSATDVDDLIHEAEMTGRRIFSMAEAHSKWRKDRNERPGLKLGFPSFDSLIAPGLRPGNVMVTLAKTGCIAGDAEVVVNRAGRSFRTTMSELALRWNGGRPKWGKPWDPDIDTYVQREFGGVVRLGKIKAAWASGRKITYEVTTSTGRTVRASDEHPFLTELGWRRLDELKLGDLVHVNVGKSANGSAKKPSYRIRCGLTGHPHAGRRNVHPGGMSVPLHRLVAEAQLNGLPLEQFLDRCRSSDVGGLQFIDPKQWAVHHIDHNPLNNDPGNLKVLTHSEHAALHAAEGTGRNVLDQIDLEAVTSIRRHGEEETYDIEVEDDPHNYIANGFVVHNTGKTQFLANCDYNMRARRVLHITLENTVSELFELLWRIYHFWNPAADDFHIERDFPYLRVVDQNQLTPADFGTIVEEYIADVGEPPEHCIIDYLGYMARSQRGISQYEKVTNAMMDTKAIAKAYDLSVHIPHQVARTQREGQPFQGDEARDSGAVEETADFEIGLYRPHDATDIRAVGSGAVDHRINAQLMKSRRGNKGRIVQLAASPASLVIADTMDHVALQRIQQEVEAYNRGMSYEDIAAGSRRAAWANRQLVTT